MEKENLIFSENKKRKIERSLWADIPGDILRLIVKDFFLHDLVRSSVVCKNWHAILKGIRPTSNLPWTFSYKWAWDYKNGASRKLTLHTSLYDLNSEKTFHVKNSNWKTSLSHKAKPCASKHGWLLFAKHLQKSHTSFFLYSPFSNNSISLPSLKSHFSVATFTKLDPTSPNSNCMLFVSYRSAKQTYIATCSIGDKTWSKQLVDTDLKETMSSVVYNEEKGEFYCVFRGGMLASFRVFDRKWSFLTQDGHGRDLTEYRHNHYLVECEGQLLLVVNEDYSRFLIFRFEWADMKWINDQNSLGNGSVFFNFSTICSSTRAFGEALLGLEGGIYYDVGTIYQSNQGHLRSTSPRIFSREEGYYWHTLWLEPRYLRF